MGKTLRKPARKGLSYFDANKHRFIHMDGDVLGVKHEILSRWPELECEFDRVDEVWVIWEHCKDGVDRFVLETTSLGPHIIERLQRADSQGREGTKDIADAVDAENEKIQREKERQFDDALGDAGERLIHAFWKDGIGGKLQVSFPGGLDGHK
jgi:hypothetical protein